MALKSNENEKENSSKNSDSIEDTMIEISQALESGVSEQDIIAKIDGETSSPAPASTKPSKQAVEEPLIAPASEEESAVEEAEEEDSEDAVGADDEINEYESLGLPASFKKDLRQLFDKVPQQFTPIKAAISKRLHDVEKHLNETKSDFQRKTAFAHKVTSAINPYLDNLVARGIPPDQAIARSLKLDEMMFKDPESTIKLLMKTAGLKSIDLDDDEVQKFQQSQQQQQLTNQPQLTQDDIVRLIDQRTNTQAQFQQKYQGNLAVVEKLTSEKTPTGSFKYPDMQREEFVQSLQPLVRQLMQDPSVSFEQAVKSAYFARGGRQPASVMQRPPVKPNLYSGQQNNNSNKYDRLRQAASLQPSQVGSNINIDELDIPDSVEDTMEMMRQLTGEY